MSPAGHSRVRLRFGPSPGRRLDKALADIVPAELSLSRSRLAALIRSGGVVAADGRVLNDPASPPPADEEVIVLIPEPAKIDATPEDIPLTIVHEDADLIVINKPAGMVVHPAPGAMSGTLVNALLHHCADSLSGIGGGVRPGIVHRIDKDTSGLLVVAKSDRAHAGLSEQFAAHTVERRYDAVVRGDPDAARARLAGMPGVAAAGAGGLRIDLPIGRHRSDRKRMAVRADGKIAVTNVAFGETLAGPARRISCRLETGRTHQIRVHLAHLGFPLAGDPVYGRGRPWPGALAALAAVAGFSRQALHAATLGFVHPVTAAPMTFSAPAPEDMTALIEALREGL